MNAQPSRTGGEVYLPADERENAAIDLERRCERCGAFIDEVRQYNALRTGRYPKHCSYVCARRAASAAWYQRRASVVRAEARRLRAARRKRRRRKSRKTGNS